MKTFKAFRVIIVVTSLAVFFANCKPKEPEYEPDTTPPELTAPKDTITIDLGDKAAVLKNVRAIDSGYIDLTSQIKITNDTVLETLGHNTVKFEVSDAAGNKATTTRTVFVRGKKLEGTYEVTAILKGSEGFPMYYNIDVVENPSNSARIQFAFFHATSATHGNGITVVLFGGGHKRLEMEEKHGINLTTMEVSAILTGEVFFKCTDPAKETYELETINYQLRPENSTTISDVQVFTTTNIKKIK